MIGGFKTENLSWINKIAVIGFTWLFVYESAHSYEEGMHAPKEIRPDNTIHLPQVLMMFSSFLCGKVSCGTQLSRKSLSADFSCSKGVPHMLFV